MLFDYAATFCATFGAFISNCENTIKVDIENNVRPHGSAWDIGAFEYHLPNCESDFDSDNDVDGSDLASVIGTGGIEIRVFAKNFGWVYCP